MKIAVLTPYLQQVEGIFAKSLADLLFVSARANADWNIGVAMEQGSSLPYNRTRLLLTALRIEADWVLWLDSDMAFPPDTLARLLATGKQVVGVNYPRRSSPPVTPTAWRDGHVYTTAEKVKAGEIEAVDHIGFGALLMASEVLKALKPPYFAIEPTGDGLHFVTEDVYFIRKVREAGFEVFVDHALSSRIGHVHRRTLTHNDIVIS